jgi:pimeloyl-ACP methyl ester carboxylesterase
MLALVSARKRVQVSEYMQISCETNTDFVLTLEIWFLFHGKPGSRLVWQSEHTYAEARNIRLICIDRPGYGHSIVKSGRRMLDFMQDVEYLLDFLGVKTFNVLGASAGGPYVLAAAYHFPKHRLLKSAIMCGTEHPRYDQTSVHINVELDRMAVNYIPFCHRFGIKYNFEPSPHEDLQAVEDNEAKMK